LQAEQVMRGRIAYQIGPGSQGLTQLNRGRPYLLERARIIGLLRLECTQARDPRQSLDRCRRIDVALDPAQGTVPRQRTAPFEQAKDMRSRPWHSKLSTPNGWRPIRP